MKKFILLNLYLLLTTSEYAQNFLRPYDQKLDSLFQILIKDPESAKKQKDFFDLFPHNFSDFNKTYNYYKKNLPDDPMHRLHYNHMKGFMQLDKIPLKEYYERLIDLGIGGKWDADAVSMLQFLIKQKMEENTRLFFILLSQYPKDKIYSFWYFYFNSLHPLKGGIPQYLLEMKNKYPAIYKQMEQAFKDSDGQATI